MNHHDERGSSEHLGTEHFGTEQGADRFSGRAVAVTQAEMGTNAWRAAARAQRSALADHSDFYALAAELVATLHALQDLAGVLAPQVAGYVASLAPGERVYDDTRSFPPQQRLDLAAIELHAVASQLGQTTHRANTFWSAIGHIGVEGVEDAEGSR